MSYSCVDFTDDVLNALKIEVPEKDRDNPSGQADLAMAEIERLQKAESVLRPLIEYAQRFADINDEPADGDCRSAIVAAESALAAANTKTPRTFAHQPGRCPSNHWNRGDDICADCGADLN